MDRVVEGDSTLRSKYMSFLFVVSVRKMFFTATDFKWIRKAQFHGNLHSVQRYSEKRTWKIINLTSK